MLIKNALIVAMDNDRRVIKNGNIYIEENKIIEIGTTKNNDSETIDAKGMVALPGFINTHCHSPMTLLRGYADDLPLMKWLTEYIWPMEKQLKPNDCYIGSKLACLEMIKSGITTFADMYFYMENIVQAVDESGIRGVLSPVINDIKPEKLWGISATKKFFENVKQSDRIIKWAGPHSPYACSEETLLKAKEIADKHKTCLHIHVSETKEEVEQSKKEKGLTPVEWLDSINFLDEHVLIAHAVWLSDREIDILSKNNVKISHCTVSNMKLASGVSPIHKMLEKNLIISLGSDGPCSNNRLDMVQEMKFCSLSQKVNINNPTVIPAVQALEMATVNGAMALGLNDVGSIEVGKKADIILLDFKKPHLTPMYNIYSHIVYASQCSDVDTVICNGKLIMKNRKVLTIDEQEILEEMEKREEDLIM